MKRLFSLLLVLALVCPMLAHAESDSMELTVSFEADEEAMEAYLDAVGHETEKTTLAKGCAELLNMLSFRWRMQENAQDMAIDLKGETILRLQMVLDDSTMLSYYSLFPGYAIRSEWSEDETAYDWDALMKALFDAAEDGLTLFDCKEEKGSFAGDAYEGGDTRLLYSFDDRDLALIVRDMLRMDEIADLAAWLEMPDEAFDDMLETSEDAAWANVYRYQLGKVLADGQMVGTSLMVLRDDEPVLTLSLGWENGAVCRVVLGYGLPNGVYYDDVRWTVDDSFLSATARIDYNRYEAAPDESFSSAQAAGQPILKGEGEITLCMEHDDLVWHSDLTMKRLEGQAIHSKSDWFINVSGQNSGLWSVSVDGVEAPAWICTVSTKESEPVELPAANVVILDEGDAAYHEGFIDATIEAGTAMGLQLIRLLPAELLSYLLDLL